MTSSIPMAAVFGCAGPELQAEEAAFFRDANPFGFILFARNCKSPKQIRRLTSALRITVGRADAPILMDHEGGRVQRLQSPPWREVAAPAQFGKLPENVAAAAVTINARLMAFELLELGIDVNCVRLINSPLTKNRDNFLCTGPFLMSNSGNESHGHVASYASGFKLQPKTVCDQKKLNSIFRKILFKNQKF